MSRSPCGADDSEQDGPVVGEGLACGLVEIVSLSTLTLYRRPAGWWARR
jgi:hypothetical protein